MKKVYFCSLIVLLTLVLAGCGGSLLNIPMTKGNLAFTMDFSTVQEQISLVRITLTTAMPEDTIVRDLTMTGKVAQGSITGLKEGSWHVRAEVFDVNNVVIYSGESDIMVIAGQTQTCQFTFTPSTDPLPGGTVEIEIIVDDFPGHQLIPQQVDLITVAKGPSPNYTYFFLDAMQKRVTQYDGMMLTPMSSYQLSDVPTAMAVSDDLMYLYLGYASGHIIRVDLASGIQEVIFNQLGNVRDILVHGTHLLVRTGIDVDVIFYILDPMSHMITASMPLPISTEPGKMLYNPMYSRLYFTEPNPSAPLLHSMTVDPMMGTFGMLNSVTTDISDLGDPLRLIDWDNKIVTSGGNVYILASDDVSNLTPAGNIGYQYHDLLVDSMSNRLYVINRYATDPLTYNPADVQMHILDGASYFRWDTITLEGQPERIFKNDDGSFVLLVQKDGAWYFRRLTLAQ